jgi:hypothetical protein
MASRNTAMKKATGMGKKKTIAPNEPTGLTIIANCMAKAR